MSPISRGPKASTRPFHLVVDNTKSEEETTIPEESGDVVCLGHDVNTHPGVMAFYEDWALLLEQRRRDTEEWQEKVRGNG